MNDKLKELIQPYWIEEQQGVYIPLIDKVLLKNNVPEMIYGDYMEYAKSNGVQVATQDDLLQMYLQKDEINKILREHNGDMLDTWFGSSSEYGSYSKWVVNFVSGYCYNSHKIYPNVSRVVVDLKNKKKKIDNMKQFTVEEYRKNPNRRVITRDGKSVRIVCTDIMGATYPVLAIYKNNPTHEVWNSYTTNGRLYAEVNDSQADLFFAPEKHEGWINLYQMDYGIYANSDVYPTKEEAERYGKFSSHANYVTSCKIEWEE